MHNFFIYTFICTYDYLCDQAIQRLSIREDQVQVILQGKQKPKADAKLVITSYEILAKNPHVQLCADGSPHKAIFVDESHYIKDPKSKRSGAVLKLCKAATRCVLISGIPAVKSAKEIYTQLQALLPMMTSAQGYFSVIKKKVQGPRSNFVNKLLKQGNA